MNIFKLMIPFLLIVLLCLPVFAEHLPEDDIIDRELIVEKDGNIVKDMLDADKGKDPTDPIGSYETFRMSAVNYFKRALLPFLLLFLIGLLAFALSVGMKFIKRREY